MNLRTVDKILHLIRPGAERSLRYAEDGSVVIDWRDKNQSQPTDEELELGEKELAKFDYCEKRALEYPTIQDQLDALWKGGEAAEAMLKQVLAVKEKYPKPE